MDAELSKSGVSWGSISVDRRSKGQNIWVRLDPKVEELIQSASEGGGYTNSLESFGRTWVGIDPTPNIKCYALDRSLDGPTYILSNVCGPIKDSKGRTNLSFLTFCGIGKPDGVRFLILGPVQAENVKEYGKNIVRDITCFLREYLVPVHIGINISVSGNF